MQITQGMEYFFSGFKLISQKGLNALYLYPYLLIFYYLVAPYSFYLAGLVMALTL